MNKLNQKQLNEIIEKAQNLFLSIKEDSSYDRSEYNKILYTCVEYTIEWNIEYTGDKLNTNDIKNIVELIKEKIQ